jgi:hypothetical protein
MTIHRFRLIAVLGVILTLWSCSVSSTLVAPDEFGLPMSGRKFYVQTKTGGTLVLHDAKLEGTRLMGFDSGNAPAVIEVSSIESVTIRKTEYYIAVLYGGVAAVAAALSIGAATAPAPPPTKCCPLIYSFDGDRFVLDAEPYGGAICRALKRTEWCRLGNLREIEGRCRVLIANDLDETEYTDEVKLLVADHAPGQEIVPDPAGRLHAVSRPLPPQRARDRNGRDILPLVTRGDSVFWESDMTPRKSGLEQDSRDELIVEFPKPARAGKVKLVVNAWTSLWGSQVAGAFLNLYGRDVEDWISSVDRRGPEYYWVLNWYAREGLYLLQAQVETPAGWKPAGMIYGGGPLVAGDKCYVMDISDVPGETLKIRLSPPVGFWRIDSLAVDYSEDSPVTATEVSAHAVKDAKGGDAAGLLAASDDDFLVLARKGDAAQAWFETPPRVPGLERSFVLKVAGYYDAHPKAEGDPNLEVIRRIHTEPGFTVRFALEEYRKQEARKSGRGRDGGLTAGFRRP